MTDDNNGDDSNSLSVADLELHKIYRLSNKFNNIGIYRPHYVLAGRGIGMVSELEMLDVVDSGFEFMVLSELETHGCHCVQKVIGITNPVLGHIAWVGDLAAVAKIKCFHEVKNEQCL